MDDDRAEVQQHPTGFLSALLAAGRDTVLTQFLAQRLDKRPHVARVDSGGDNEVVGKRGHPANVQQDDLFRLPVGQQVNDSTGDVGRLCQRPLPRKRSMFQAQYSTLAGLGAQMR